LSEDIDIDEIALRRPFDLRRKVQPSVKGGKRRRAEMRETAAVEMRKIVPGRMIERKPF
jgi:hypothetical protein